MWHGPRLLDGGDVFFRSFSTYKDLLWRHKDVRGLTLDVSLLGDEIYKLSTDR